MSAPLLAIEDVSLSFRGIRALTGLSFAVQPGEICSLIGPNGAGKSSLLNVINGVYKADSGAILFDGRRYAQLSPREAARLGIGRTFQNNALFKRLSVLDNVLAGLSRKSEATLVEYALQVGRARSETQRFRDHAEEVIAFLEIEAYRDTVVGALPYGLQKRVEIARALVAEPRLLLLDEPMAGMNQDEKAEICRFIIDVNRELESTVVLIEHDIGVVMGLSDHVVVLDYGRKVGDGTPDEVRTSPEVIAAYLGGAH